MISENFCKQIVHQIAVGSIRLINAVRFPRKLAFFLNWIGRQVSSFAVHCRLSVFSTITFHHYYCLLKVSYIWYSYKHNTTQKQNGRKKKLYILPRELTVQFISIASFCRIAGHPQLCSFHPHIALSSRFTWIANVQHGAYSWSS